MDSHRDIERAAAEWLARRSDGGQPWTEADQLALDAWLSASVAHQVAYIRLRAVWTRADRLQALGAGVPAGEVPEKDAWRQSPFFTHPALGRSAAPQAGQAAAAESASGAAADHAALRFLSRRERPRRSRGLRLAAAAGAILLMATLSLGGWYWYGHAPIAVVEHRAALGDTREVRLPDGSGAVLGSDTRLRLTLTRRTRRVDLERGEAYFQVVPDVRRPFTVRVEGISVTAVGTRFAVRTAAGGDGPESATPVRVVVTEGAVRVESAGAGTAPSTPLLTAGDVAVVRGGTVQVKARSLEQAERALGWRRGELVFSATPLAEAAAEFNRHNARRIVIEDPGLARIAVDGGFRVHNVDGFVRLLELAFEVDVERGDREVVLRRR